MAVAAAPQPSPRRNVRLPLGAGFAVVASAAMVAQQVAGKATRDAFYLSNFNVKTLPAMMGFSAVASLVIALWLSRMMLRHTPAKVVPAGFGLSAVILLGTWALSFPAPRLAALALYLYTSLFGAAMISAFWSLINETYDPHASRSAVTAIASGGTLGGLLGGLAAWQMSSIIAVPTMLPLLAGASLLSMWGSWSVRRRMQNPVPSEKSAGDGQAPAKVVPDTLADMTLAPFRRLRGAPYLRNLAAIVALGAVTSGLLDYVFSAEATRAFSKGPALLSFFSCFWLVVGVLSFGLQVLFGKLALEKLGIVLTVALLPAVVVFGGAVGLVVPGLWSTAVLRGGEATQRNSLFRAAYEMLYTPLSEEKKRSTKVLIDVGFDRIGTVTAAGVVMLTLGVAGGHAEMALLLLAIGIAIVTVARSRSLHAGYVAALGEGLRKEAAKAGVSIPSTSLSGDEKMAVRDAIVDNLVALPHGQELAALAAGDVERATALSADTRSASTPAQVAEALDTSLHAVSELVSRDPERVRRVLSSEVLVRPVVSIAILLLADRDLHGEAMRALRKWAPKVIGQLVDTMCDASAAFDVRRRIPRVLADHPTQDAANGLLCGMADERFEVRYECGRALLKITEHDRGVVIAQQQVIALVKKELLLGKDVLESQPAPELDEEEGEAPALIARLLRDRIDRSLEHIFTLLALNLDRVSLRLAFKALHETDERLRGTALEYLETVLPDEVRDAVWPFLGEAHPMLPPRPALEILADLRRSNKAAGIGLDPAASTRPTA
jgi:hypothetical protein